MELVLVSLFIISLTQMYCFYCQKPKPGEVMILTSSLEMHKADLWEYHIVYANFQMQSSYNYS
jgi:hypothetical protein